MRGLNPRRSSLIGFLSIWPVFVITMACGTPTEPTPTPTTTAVATATATPTTTAASAPVPLPTETPTTTPTAVPDRQPDSAKVEPTEARDFTQLWSYGLTSIRTGEPLIEEGGEHKLDESAISYGYNLVVDKNGTVLRARATPLQNGDQLVLTEDYQGDHNMREYARIFTIMAPIRDTILYHFGATTRDEWLAFTEILTINKIKTEDAVEISGRNILSTEQVYDYITNGEAEGSAVMRYLEEAGLELKCLAFKDFDFTNPEGRNHCEEHDIGVGSGIELP